MEKLCISVYCWGSLFRKAWPQSQAEPCVPVLSSCCPLLVLLGPAGKPVLLLFCWCPYQLCVLLLSSSCSLVASSGPVCDLTTQALRCPCPGLLAALRCPVLVRVCLSCLPTLLALLSPPCPACLATPWPFPFLHRLVRVCFLVATNATVMQRLISSS